MKLIIEVVDNGYVITNLSSLPDDPMVKTVVQDIDSFIEHSELLTTQRLLWAIMDTLGLQGNKHTGKVVIRVEHEGQYIE